MPPRNKEQRTKAFMTGTFLASLTALAMLIVAVTWLSGRNPSKAWPFALTAIGFAGLYAGLAKSGKYDRGYVVPSAIFIIMSLVFAAFSFDIVPDRFGTWVMAYWPLLLLAGTGLILAVWRYSLYRRAKKAETRKRTSGRRGAGTRSSRPDKGQ